MMKTLFFYRREIMEIYLIVFMPSCCPLKFGTKTTNKGFQWASGRPHCF